MTKRHLQHVKSNVLNGVYPKLPSVGDIHYGEIAVNYAQGLETLSLKNSNNEIVSFTPNSNVYVAIINDRVSDNSVAEILSQRNVYRYQDFNITYMNPFGGNYDLSYIIKYIRDTYYDVSNLHVMLNIAKGDDEDGRHTNFIVNSELMAEMMSEASNQPLHEKSMIIGFMKYDSYFIAGDSTAMSGIEINWDVNTKAITVRFVYLDGIYRLDGNDVN